jgi:hypothetical protein
LKITEKEGEIGPHGGRFNRIEHICRFFLHFLSKCTEKGTYSAFSIENHRKKTKKPDTTSAGWPPLLRLRLRSQAICHFTPQEPQQIDRVYSCSE